MAASILQLLLCPFVALCCCALSLLYCVVVSKRLFLSLELRGQLKAYANSAISMCFLCRCLEMFAWDLPQKRQNASCPILVCPCFLYRFLQSPLISHLFILVIISPFPMCSEFLFNSHISHFLIISWSSARNFRDLTWQTVGFTSTWFWALTVVFCVWANG